MTVLVLGPFATTEESERKCQYWMTKLRAMTGLKLRMVIGDPPFEVEEDIDGKGYWLRPRQAKPDARRKEMRKHILTSIMLVLSYAVRFRPQIILGVEQGGLIASLMTFPALIEQTCSARIAESRQMSMIRQAWAHVAAVIAINPLMLPQRSEYEEMAAAVPEMRYQQPRNLYRVMIQADKSYLRKKFGDEVAAEMGIVSFTEEEAMKSALAEDLKYSLSVPVPLYIEDDPGGVGACAVCGKRGVLGRCAVCGLLMHYTCVVTEPLDRHQKCPKCNAEDPALEELPEEPWRMGIHGHKYTKTQTPYKVSQSDGRIKMTDLTVRPTDDEAKEHGFTSAKEWYHYSMGEALP